MARLPHAEWAPVSFQGQLAYMPAPPKTVFLHTNGGGADIYGPNGYFSNLFNEAGPNYHVGIGATVQVLEDGTALQMCDSAQVIWAQFQASRWSASIETEDDGNPATPWTDLQLASIAQVLLDFQLPTYALMTDPYSAGVGYHQQWTPTWNNDYHDCPGPVRVNQIRTELIPYLLGHPAADPVMSALPLLVPGDVGHGVQSTAARALLNAYAGANGPFLPYCDAAGHTLDYDKGDTAFAFAIGSFQAHHGLVTDMRIGPATWAALLNVHNALPTVSAQDPTHWGQWLNNVRSLLEARGYFLLARTGGWDTAVTNCLEDFQRKHGLAVDGVVGQQTWAALLGVTPKASATMAAEEPAAA